MFIRTSVEQWADFENFEIVLFLRRSDSDDRVVNSQNGETTWKITWSFT